MNKVFVDKLKCNEFKSEPVPYPVNLFTGLISKVIFWLKIWDQEVKHKKDTRKLSISYQEVNQVKSKTNKAHL